MSKNIKSISDLSTYDIKRLYNIDKIIRQKDLPQLAKTYKDNLKTLIVSMDIKTKRTTITLNDLMKEIKSVKENLNSFKHEIKSDITKIKQQQTKDHNLLMRIIKKNHLKV